MGPAVPGCGLLFSDQSKVGLVHQDCWLDRLARLLMGQLGCGDPAAEKASWQRLRPQLPGQLVKTVIEELEAASILAVTTERKAQGIPRLIPITREKEGHTEQIGTFAHGQYAGFVFYLEPMQKRLVSVLHVFDKFGIHQRSNAWDSLTGCDPQVELKNAIGGLVHAIPSDIQIQLFSVEFFGVTFGLIQSGSSHVEYVPCGLGFNSPWNGLYNT